MNVLINFSTLKKGGGQNVALNFLSTFEDVTVGLEKKFVFIVAQDSAIEEIVKCKKIRYYVFPKNPIKRIIYELFYGPSIIKNNRIDIIYSYFGYALFPKRVPQISGAVDSNLYFPEIDFWAGNNILMKFKHKLIDQYRLYGLKHSKGIIFENKGLEQRAHELYNFKGVTITILPSININYKREEIKIKRYTGEKLGLFLCGWHLNKNVLLIPNLVYSLNKYGKKFRIIITASRDNSATYKKFIALVKKYNVENEISIIGPVRKEELFSLYNQIDYVFLLSKLESFSNNIIESWTYKKVLIISDEFWARAICGNAAVFVNRDSVDDIVLKTIHLVNDDDLYKNVVINGNSKLQNYPSVMDKTTQELLFIDKIYGQF